MMGERIGIHIFSHNACVPRNLREGQGPGLRPEGLGQDHETFLLKIHFFPLEKEHSASFSDTTDL